MQSEGMAVMVNAIVADDGRLVVKVEWPDGQKRVLDRDEAVGLALLLLSNAALLFPSAEEFSNTIAFARGAIQKLHPPNRAEILQ